MLKNHKTLEEGILSLQEKARHSSLSIEEILHILAGRGRPLALILLSLPFCQPLQIPGLSTPFGLAIVFVSFRMAFGKRIWLLKRILAKKISSATLQKITQKTLKIIRKMNRWIYPRFKWVCRHSFMQVFNSMAIAALGIFLALPLPIPLSNLTAAWSIFFIALGVLEDDGLFVFVGYAISLLTIGVLLVTAFTAEKIF